MVVQPDRGTLIWLCEKRIGSRLSSIVQVLSSRRSTRWRLRRSSDETVESRYPSQHVAGQASGRSCRVARVGLPGSPRLTVVLVLAAIGIVMVGTLAQVQMDIWEVVNDYFRAWVCWVELKLLFPVSFFPWAARTDWDSLPVSRFPYPGGALIGLALVINLAAVLVARFQVKARGARLAWGLLVLAAGVATTWLVIEAGHNRHGLQGKPLLEWSTLWLLIRAGLVGLWLACIFGLVRVFRLRLSPANRRVGDAWRWHAGTEPGAGMDLRQGRGGGLDGLVAAHPLPVDPGPGRGSRAVGCLRDLVSRPRGQCTAARRRRSADVRRVLCEPLCRRAADDAC